jgi:AraC family transcriptional regulator of adaptative response / DNA-3-methyladenine glycosylase II
MDSSRPDAGMAAKGVDADLVVAQRQLAGLCVTASFSNQGLRTLHIQIAPPGVSARALVGADPVSSQSLQSVALWQQLEAYFAGETTLFDVPLDLRGTPFQVAVWRALLDIPYGAVRTYGEVARAVGCPRAARPVGVAVGKNPVAIVVPCHRVIGADGTMTGYAGGLAMKRRLLEREGRADVRMVGHARFAF